MRPLFTFLLFILAFGITSAQLTPPNLLSPTNTATGVNVQATFSWSNVAGTTGYNLQVGKTNAPFAPNVGQSGFQALTTVQITGGYANTFSASKLDFDSTYYWRVIATDGADFDTSAVFSFTADDAASTPLTVVNGLTGVTIEPSFTWTAVSFVDSFKFFIATDAAFTANVDSASAALNTSISFDEFDSGFPLNSGTKYYWKIRSYADGDLYWDSVVWHFTTVPDISIAHAGPVAGDTVFTTTTTFSWSPGSVWSSFKFKVQVTSTTSAPSTPDWEVTPDFESVVSGQLSTEFELLKNKTYYWRIVVLNQSDEVLKYSTNAEFFTENNFTEPNQSWPVGNPTVYTNTPSLYWWMGSGLTDLSWEVRFKKTGGATWTEVKDITNMFVTIPATGSLDAGTEYEWQSRTIYKKGTADSAASAWAASDTFTTKGSGTLVKPVASYPLDWATVYSTSPYLYWYLNDVGDGLTYNVYYKDSVDAGYTFAGNTSDMNFQLTNLTAGSTYFWYVESDNTVGTLASDVAKFVVYQAPTGGYPVATWPVGNPTLYTGTPTLNWYLEGNQTGLTKYTVRWKKNTNSTNWNSDYTGSADVNDLNTTFYEFGSSLDFGARYYWAVASYDGSSYSAWSADTFTIVGGAGSGDPVLSYPVGGETVFGTEVTLLWYLNSSSIGVDDYSIVISRSDVYHPAVTNTYTSSTMEYEVTNLVPGATYYWKVLTNYIGGAQSNYSNPEGVFTVEAGAAPIQPIIGGPTNNVVANTTDPQLSWVIPSAPAEGTTFELEISDNPDMRGLITYSDIEDPYLLLSGLDEEQMYYWRVRSKNKDGNISYYSNTGSFKTTGMIVSVVKEDNLIPDAFDVAQNFPNPFNPTTTIRFSIPEDVNVRIVVYNMLGQEVKTIMNENKSAGTYSATWNGTDNYNNKVASGAYIYQVTAGANKITKKMLLLK